MRTWRERRRWTRLCRRRRSCRQCRPRSSRSSNWCIHTYALIYSKQYGA